MKIILAGGSGQVGTILSRALAKDGHEIVVLSRSPRGSGGGDDSIRTVMWDAKALGPWADEINDAHVVINLAGRSVNCRYNAANRREIMGSRIDSTRIIGEAITLAKSPPRIWLQASTATIYAHRYDAPNDELTGLIGGNEPNAPDTWLFSIDVAKAWEQTLNEADTPRTRKVLCGRRSP